MNKNNIEFEIFNFSNKLEEYFSKAELATTRSGSSHFGTIHNAKNTVHISTTTFVC